jgi:hypothetical protein
LNATQTAGAPSLTNSGQHIVEGCATWTHDQGSGAAASAVSVGTYVQSGAVSVAAVEVPGGFINLGALVSGGTWTLSGLFTFSVSGVQTPTFVGINQNGTGGTVTISSATFTLYHGQLLAGTLISTTATAGSSTMSSAVLLIKLHITGTFKFVIAAAGAGITATFSGTFTMRHSSIDGTVVLMTSGAGATATGPSAAIDFIHCYFASTFTDNSGAGTITWTGASLRFRHSHVDGIMTLLGTQYTTVESFFSRFNGATANKSITMTGTRPTTYRYWSCSFAQRYDDDLPEIINVYDVLPAQAALVQGQPVFVNGANQYQVCVAGSVVDGVLLAAAGGAGTFAVAVRHGRVFVAVNAGVVNGSNLILDTVTPTQANAGAAVVAQEIGTALEAAGATVAGKAYSAVNVR